MAIEDSTSAVMSSGPVTEHQPVRRFQVHQHPPRAVGAEGDQAGEQGLSVADSSTSTCPAR